MNVCLLFACMTVLPVITGRGVFTLIYRKHSGKIHMADCLIMGWLVTIGLAEGAHLAAVFLGWSVSKVSGLWLVGLTAVTFVCGGISLLLGTKNRKTLGIKEVGRTKKGGKKELTHLRFGLFLAFALLLIWQIVTIVSYESAYRTGDMTVETVESFLQTDGVYSVNPLTGKEYTIGIPLRIKILGLPTLYCALCSIFQIPGTELVWKYIPLLVMILSYSAYWLMAAVLFEKENERDKRLIFMAFVSFLFSVGDYSYGMDGFGLLHCGYQGVVIRNLVLIPYAFVLCLRRKWLAVGLVVLAEACITWTFYGLGASAFVLAGMAAIWLWRSRRDKRRWQVGELLKESEEA